MVTYATPPMEARRQKNKKNKSVPCCVIGPYSVTGPLLRQWIIFEAPASLVFLGRSASHPIFLHHFPVSDNSFGQRGRNCRLHLAVVVAGGRGGGER